MNEVIVADGRAAIARSQQVSAADMPHDRASSARLAAVLAKALPPEAVLRALLG